MSWFLQYTLSASIVLVYVIIHFGTSLRNQNKFVTLTTQSSLEEATDVDSHSIKYGVLPIQQWYHEIPVENSEYVSSPGCPSTIDGIPWVYYGSKCFLAGFQGPCEGHQKITLQMGSLYGICACNCFAETHELHLHLPQVSGRYIECQYNRRYYIYDRQNEKCYEKFRQGPCSDGYVITKWTDDSLTCFRICDGKPSVRNEMYKQGLCIPIPSEVRAAAGMSSLPQHTCPAGKYWSSHLRMCVRRLKPNSPVG